MSKVHELTISPEYFNAVTNGFKRFEIRKNDRDYEVGDFLILEEQEKACFTGNKTAQEITYISDYEQKEDYVVLSINKVPRSFINYLAMSKKEKSIFQEVLSHIRLYGYGNRSFSNTLADMLEILLDGEDMLEEDLKWYGDFWSEDKGVG